MSTPLTEMAQSILAIMRASKEPMYTHAIYEHPTFRAVRSNPQAMGRAFHQLLQRKLIERVAPRRYRLGPAEPQAESLRLGTEVPAPEILRKKRYRRRKALDALPIVARPRGSISWTTTPTRSMMVEVKAGSELALTIGDIRLMVRAVH